MSKRLHSHNCRRCERHYHSYDPQMVYCSSACEGRDEYERMYPHAKKRAVRQEKLKEPKPLTYDRTPDQRTKEILAMNERWGKRKHPSEKPRQEDLKNKMYRDTFKKWVPKRLKVMRG